MTRRWLFLLPVVVFAVVAGYFLWGLDPLSRLRGLPGRDPSAVPSALVDKPVPDFELPPVDGMDVPGLSSADLRNGEVALVNFFASWCVPCRYEHPFLMQFAEDKVVRVLGINYRDKPEDARRWLAQLGNPYSRIGADENGRVAIDWGLSGVPETFLIDKDGRIRYQHLGPMTPQILKQTIVPMIEELSR